MHDQVLTGLDIPDEIWIEILLRSSPLCIFGLAVSCKRLNHLIYHSELQTLLKAWCPHIHEIEDFLSGAPIRNPLEFECPHSSDMAIRSRVTYQSLLGKTLRWHGLLTHNWSLFSPLLSSLNAISFPSLPSRTFCPADITAHFSCPGLSFTDQLNSLGGDHVELRYAYERRDREDCPTIRAVISRPGPAMKSAEEIRLAKLTDAQRRLLDEGRVYPVQLWRPSWSPLLPPSILTQEEVYVHGPLIKERFGGVWVRGVLIKSKPSSVEDARVVCASLRQPGEQEREEQQQEKEEDELKVDQEAVSALVSCFHYTDMASMSDSYYGDPVSKPSPYDFCELLCN